MAGLLLASCTGQEEPPEVGVTSPPTVRPTPSASAEAPEGGEVEIEFAYQPPDRPCPPPSELVGLPSAEENPYILSRSVLDDGESLPESLRNIFVRCIYEPAVAEDETVVLLDDHLILIAEMVLFRSWAESYWPDGIPVFPVASDDIHDWVPTPDDSLSYRGVWREGCEPGASTCAEDADPAARNFRWYLRRQGHVGNLQFELIVYYVTDKPPRETVRGEETPPPEAGERMVTVMRDFVRLVVDSWEHAD